MDAIFRTYKEVLGFRDDATVAGILANLNQNKATSNYFTDLVPTLQTVAIENGTDVRIGRASSKNTILPDPVAKGAFGEIFRNTAGTMIYKKILISGVPQYTEWMVRSTFLEAFIQTVLGMDATYGKHICHVHRVFRAAETVRHTPRNKNATRDIILYIVMEPIAYTLGNKLDMLSSDGDITFKVLSPYFAQLGHVLDGLKRNYNFSHRDLHTGNVMFRDDDTLTLIDFGASCFTMNGVTYAINRDNILHPSVKNLRPGSIDAPCESYDILMFLTAFAEGYGVAMPEKENQKLTDIFDSRDKSFNLLGWLFDIFMSLPEDIKPDAVFHMTYYNYIMENWPADIKAKLPTIPGIRPDNFAALSEGFGRVMRNRVGGATRKKRRSLRRKN